MPDRPPDPRQESTPLSDGPVRTLQQVGRLLAFTGHSRQPLSPAQVWRIQQSAFKKIRAQIMER